MQKIYFLLMLLLIGAWMKAQVVVSEPAIPVESEAVTIVFRADEGTKGLMGYTGEVYAHTGVITSESTSNSDWKYVVAEWDENVEKARDRKSTRLNSSHVRISYAVFCLKKK